MRASAGYAVLPSPFAAKALASVRRAIAAAHVDPREVRVGSTTTRINGILGRVPELRALLDHAPLLAAAPDIIGGPFRLSSLHARSVMPGAVAQVLHQDVAPGAEAWPLAGFVLMLDPFTELNGATRFVPDSRDIRKFPGDEIQRHPREVQACGPAGSIVVFDGSTWHGHGANTTASWRHSVQGAFIPRTAAAAVEFKREVPVAVWRNLSVASRNLLR